MHIYYFIKNYKKTIGHRQNFTVLKILKIDFIDETEKVPNFLINNIFKKIFSFEKYFINKFSFPFGLSLLAIVKKK